MAHCFVTYCRGDTAKLRGVARGPSEGRRSKGRSTEGQQRGGGGAGRGIWAGGPKGAEKAESRGGKALQQIFKNRKKWFKNIKKSDAREKNWLTLYVLNLDQRERHFQRVLPSGNGSHPGGGENN